MVRFASLLLLVGCFDPRPPEGVPCGPDRSCPSGQSCDDLGFCVVDPTDRDDAGVDAPVIPPDVMRPPAGWYATTPLPAARSLACAVAADDRIYAIGGSLNGTSQTTVWTTRIESNGALVPWTETTPLPVATRWHACAMHAATGSVYVIGGDAGATARTTVYRASLTPTGLGPWSMQAALPAGRRGFGAAIVGSTLYAIGGEESQDFTLRNTVFASTIAADGALGAWTTTTPLPAADYMFGTAVRGNDIYLTGGYTQNAKVSRAAATPGALGAVMAMTPLPGSRERHASVVDATHLYVMGGEPSYPSSNVRTVLRASLEGGGVGAWTPLPDMLEAVAYASSVTSNGYIYVIGGSTDNGQIANVQLLVPP